MAASHPDRRSCSSHHLHLRMTFVIAKPGSAARRFGPAPGWISRSAAPVAPVALGGLGSVRSQGRLARPPANMCGLQRAGGSLHSTKRSLGGPERKHNRPPLSFQGRRATSIRPALLTSRARPMTRPLAISRSTPPMQPARRIWAPVALPWPRSTLAARVLSGASHASLCSSTSVRPLFRPDRLSRQLSSHTLITSSFHPPAYPRRREVEHLLVFCL
jgi:hypothetical protein